MWAVPAGGSIQIIFPRVNEDSTQGIQLIYPHCRSSLTDPKYPSQLTSASSNSSGEIGCIVQDNRMTRAQICTAGANSDPSCRLFGTEWRGSSSWTSWVVTGYREVAPGSNITITGLIKPTSLSQKLQDYWVISYQNSDASDIFDKGEMIALSKFYFQRVASEPEPVYTLSTTPLYLESSMTFQDLATLRVNFIGPLSFTIQLPETVPTSQHVRLFLPKNGIYSHQQNGFGPIDQQDLICLFRNLNASIATNLICNIVSYDYNHGTNESLIVLSHPNDELVDTVQYQLVIEYSTNSQMEQFTDSHGIAYPAVPDLYHFRLEIDGSASTLMHYFHFEVVGRELNVSMKSCVQAEREWNLLEFDIRPQAQDAISPDDWLVVEIPYLGLEGWQPAPSSRLFENFDRGDTQFDNSYQQIDQNYLRQSKAQLRPYGPIPVDVIADDPSLANTHIIYHMSCQHFPSDESNARSALRIMCTQFQDRYRSPINASDQDWTGKHLHFFVGVLNPTLQVDELFVPVQVYFMDKKKMQKYLFARIDQGIYLTRNSFRSLDKTGSVAAPISQLRGGASFREIDQRAELELDVLLGAAVTELTSYDYYILHFNFELNYPESQAYLSGFTYGASAGNLVVCKALRLLLLQPAAAESLKNGRVTLTQWSNPDHFLLDVPLQFGLFEKLVYATAAGISQRASAQANYTSELLLGGQAIATTSADVYRLKMNLIGGSAGVQHRSDLEIGISGKSFHKVNRISIEFPSMLQSALFQTVCIESGKSEIQVQKCWFDRANNSLVLWIHVHARMKSLSLADRFYDLFVQTTDLAFENPDVTLPSASMAFTLKTYRWVDPYNITDSTQLNAWDNVLIYEALQVPNSVQTVHPFQVDNPSFQFARTHSPEPSKFFTAEDRYDDTLPHFSNGWERIPLEFDLVLPAATTASSLYNLTVAFNESLEVPDYYNESLYLGDLQVYEPVCSINGIGVDCQLNKDYRTVQATFKESFASGAHLHVRMSLVNSLRFELEDGTKFGPPPARPRTRTRTYVAARARTSVTARTLPHAHTGARTHRHT